MAYEAGSGATGSGVKNGKYYLVGSNGKAPSGLNTGDYVVTGGGTYQIYGFNSDGSYKSKKVSDANTYNYQDYGITLSKLGSSSGSGTTSKPSGGSVNSGTVNQGSIAGSSSNKTTTAQDVAQKTSPATSNQRPNSSTPSYAGNGSTVSNYGQGSLSYESNGRIIRTMPDGRRYYVDPGDEKYESIYNEYVSTYGAPQQAQQNQQTSDDIFEQMYQQSQVPEYKEPEETKDLTDLVYDLIGQLQNNQYKPVDTNAVLNNAMSYDEAYELATSILTPQYKGLYDQAAVSSAQNLDRAGLINSLYGQQLAANAQNRVSDQLMAAIPQLAMELQGADRQWAQSLLQNLVDENRYAFETTQSQLTATASAALSLINSIANRAAQRYDYQASRAAQQLQQQAQILEAKYMAGTLTQQQLDTEMMKLQIEAQQLENQAARSGGGKQVTAGDDNINLDLGSNDNSALKGDGNGNADVEVGGSNISELARNIAAIYNSAGADNASTFVDATTRSLSAEQLTAFVSELQKLGISLA